VIRIRIILRRKLHGPPGETLSLEFPLKRPGVVLVVQRNDALHPPGSRLPLQINPGKLNKPFYQQKRLFEMSMFLSVVIEAGLARSGINNRYSSDFLSSDRSNSMTHNKLLLCSR
jgi:hypothetical protein